jgi:hypothetical protein
MNPGSQQLFLFSRPPVTICGKRSHFLVNLSAQGSVAGAVAGFLLLLATRKVRAMVGVTLVLWVVVSGYIRTNPGELDRGPSLHPVENGRV